MTETVEKKLHVPSGSVVVRSSFVVVRKYRKGDEIWSGPSVVNEEITNYGEYLVECVNHSVYQSELKILSRNLEIQTRNLLYVVMPNVWLNDLII